MIERKGKSHEFGWWVLAVRGDTSAHSSAEPIDEHSTMNCAVSLLRTLAATRTNDSQSQPFQDPAAIPHSGPTTFYKPSTNPQTVVTQRALS